MLKKISVLFLSLVLISTCINPISKANAEELDKIYEKHYSIDLSNIDMKVSNNNIKLYYKDEILSEKNLFKIRNNLKPNNSMKEMQKLIDENENFKKDLIKDIKNGKAPIAIGVATAEFEITKDINGKIVNERPLSVKEVKNNTFKATPRAKGETQYRDTLQLFTSVSGKSPNYWVQVNAYWGKANTSNGWEAAGITWDKSFYAKNSTSTKAVYTGATKDKKGSPEKFKSRAGVSWAFPNIEYYGGGDMDGLKGFYGGISVTRDGKYGNHTFTGEYIHTFHNFKWTAEVSADSSGKTGAKIILSPMKDSWRLVSWVQGKF